jgi:hypothetical protein
MMSDMECFDPGLRLHQAPRSLRVEAGFSLVEFLLFSLMLMILAGSVFTLLSQTQRSAGYQLEIQGVLESTRFAMMTLERILQQAGNDPFETGLVGISEMSATQVRVKSDLTGSGGTATPSEPDKGDPDGDDLDANEDVIISYNLGSGTISVGGQPLAGNISAFLLEYFDKNGAATATGADVTRIRVAMTGRSTAPDPRTGQPYALRIASDVKLLRVIK